VAALIRDVANHNGLLRSLGRKLLAKKNKTEYGTPVKASYAIIDEDRRSPNE
jgi:hypothetical protein